MPLNFDYRKVNTEGWEDEDYAILDQCIWSSLSVGLGELTEKNLEEWLFRLSAIDLLNGVNRANAMESNLKMLRKCVGLSTNVSNITRKKFLNEIKARLESRVKNDVSWTLEKENHEAVA